MNLIEVPNLLDAERMIGDALRSGDSSNTGLIEALAIAILGLSEDKPRQLSIAVNAALFLYVSGRPDRGLEVA